MTAHRRLVIRPAIPNRTAKSVRLNRLRSQLEQEQRLLINWTGKLKRAFNSFVKYQQRIARTQRRIRDLEES